MERAEGKRARTVVRVARVQMFIFSVREQVLFRLFLFLLVFIILILNSHSHLSFLQRDSLKSIISSSPHEHERSSTQVNDSHILCHKLLVLTIDKLYRLSL